MDPENKFLTYLHSQGAASWERAVRALKAVLELCAEVAVPDQVLDPVRPEERRGQALRLLLQLDEALTSGLAYLDRTLPELIREGRPRETLRQALRNERQRLGELKSRLEELERDIRALEIQAQVRSDLEQEVERQQRRLERLRSLAGDPRMVADLRSQLRNLEQAIQPEMADIESLEQAVGEKANTLLSLTEEQLHGLEPQVQRALQLAEAKRRELEEACRRLNEFQGRYETLLEQEDVQADRLAEELLRGLDILSTISLRDGPRRIGEMTSLLLCSLRPYLEADEPIARAADVQTALEGIQEAAERVRKAEETLRATIEEREHRSEQLQRCPFHLG